MLSDAQNILTSVLFSTGALKVLLYLDILTSRHIQLLCLPARKRPRSINNGELFNIEQKLTFRITIKRAQT